jgi:hypothetical protein
MNKLGKYLDAIVTHEDYYNRTDSRVTYLSSDVSLVYMQKEHKKLVYIYIYF